MWEVLAQQLRAFFSEFSSFASGHSYQALGFPHRPTPWPVQRLSRSWPVQALLFSHLQLSLGSPVSLVLAQPVTIGHQLCISYWVFIPAVNLITQVSPGKGVQNPCFGRGGSCKVTITAQALLQSCRWQLRCPGQGPGPYHWLTKSPYYLFLNVICNLWLPNFISARILLAVHSAPWNIGLVSPLGAGASGFSSHLSRHHLQEP